MNQTLADKLLAVMEDVRADIQQARADGDADRRSYHRGELYGLKQAHDLVTRTT